MWDLRKGEAILESRQHEEYISAMAVDGNKKILLTARYCRCSVAPGSRPRAHHGRGTQVAAPRAIRPLCLSQR